MKFHHVALTVKDFSASLPFYESNFDLKEVKRFRRDDMGATGCLLQGENIIIELWQFDTFQKGTTEDLTFSGLKHIAFTVDDVEALRNSFIEKGITCRPIRKGASGGTYFFLSDPDGNQIEIYKPVHVIEDNLYSKDFDTWNKLKKSIHKKEVGDDFNFHAGDVWWTTLGLNIGKEMDGKNETFERPVLILKVINRHTMYILPLTSKDHFVDKYHYKVDYEEGGSGVIVFSQVKVISSNRLLRKFSRISKADLQKVTELFTKLFI